MTRAESIADRLATIVGGEHILQSEADRAYFSTDLSFEPTPLAGVVVQPGSTGELAEVVRVAYEAGVAIVPRGGGMSYTLGYTPRDEGALLVDTRRLRAVRDVNPQDLVAVVETGLTWEEVTEACKAHGVRTRFWGTVSGRYAQVGGGLSSNAVWWGGGRHGMLADSVLGLEVVAGGGRVIRTGSWARRDTSPFSRHFGPDLTGAFIADSGALGVKSAAAIRLEPLPAATSCLSLACDSYASMTRATEAMSRLDVASEIWGIDSYFHRAWQKRGFDLLMPYPWSVHAIVDGPDEAIAEAGVAALRRAGRPHGTEVEPVVPTLTRGAPFEGVEPIMLGPAGEIWLPIHALVPYSRAYALGAACEAYMDDHRELLEAHGITFSVITLAVKHEYLFEPSFYWHDELGDFRLERISAPSAEQYRKIPANEAARAVVRELRQRLTEILDEHGAVHFQIGRYYPYRELVAGDTWSVLAALKRELDPAGLINPGALGL